MEKGEKRRRVREDGVEGRKGKTVVREKGVERRTQS